MQHAHNKENIFRYEIEQSLEAILQDERLMRAPKMSAFLEFVVKEALDGNIARLKAYTIAVEALGKPGTFDPQNDSTVRVLANRLRGVLADYYSRKADIPIFIRMVPGSYAPIFMRLEETNTVLSSSSVTPISLATDPNQLSNIEMGKNIIQ